MLRPHDREDAELGEVRLPPQRVEDPLIFLAGEAVLGDDLRRDRGFGHAGRIASADACSYPLPPEREGALCGVP